MSPVASSLGNRIEYRVYEDVQRVLEHDNHDNRRRLRVFFKNPLFLPRFNVPLHYEREIALERLRAIADNKFISVLDFERNPLNIFAVHEVCGMVDGSMSTKLTVQWNLFGGTLLRLGTERHHRQFLQGIDTLDAMGCFALTELGYGNNAVEMETTATYIKETKEIEITTPTVLSQKVWITNGAVHAKWAIVFAQLIVAGKREGVHAVLARIRNEDMSVCPGVTVRDMGHKHGCNGVDNAVLGFRRVRVPVSQLLDRYTQIGDDHVLRSSLPAGRPRFLKVSDQLLSGRLCIASMSLGGCKALLLTALRYSHTRLAAGVSGRSDTSILSFQLQQNALVPLLASTVGLNIGLNMCKRIYASHMTSAQRNSAPPVAVLVHACVIKPLVTWHFERVASICRERCGGQGYLSCNMFGPGIGFAHAGISAEGDNAVLMQKVAKELIGVSSLRENNGSSITAEIGELALRCYELLRAREKTAKDRLAKLMFEASTKAADQGQQSQEGKSERRHPEVVKAQFRVWMKEQADLVQTVARAFGERMCVEEFARTIGAIKNTESARVLRDTLDVFASHLVVTGMRGMVTLGVLDTKEAAAIDAQYTAKISETAKIAMNLAHSLGVEEDLLATPASQDWAAYNLYDNQGEVVATMSQKRSLSSL